ncbi:hypothetical protein BDV40DRAFT_300697 [Aspergillus tamarii]|uniref:Uncharacterized protein n=1 Tax=Aspergillus tamarii TaxID=41984 RepID=A0A5N6UU08_ASPTM|nr:hypothetical protein BDV40DRAFT_300697 [Aspergillus tamarii]
MKLPTVTNLLLFTLPLSTFAWKIEGYDSEALEGEANKSHVCTLLNLPISANYPIKYNLEEDNEDCQALLFPSEDCSLNNGLLLTGLSGSKTRNDILRILSGHMVRFSLELGYRSG